jgi:hypothetical protein
MVWELADALVEEGRLARWRWCGTSTQCNLWHVIDAAHRSTVKLRREQNVEGNDERDATS